MLIKKVPTPSGYRCAAALCATAVVTSAALAIASDCGHPPKMHTCADGQTRIRMNLEQNVALSELTSTTQPGVPVLIFTLIEDNPTCTWSEYTRGWSSSCENGYSVSASNTAGVSVEVGVGTPEWSPIAAEAKVQASASVTITGELQRRETHTLSDSIMVRVRCAKHTVNVYRAIKLGTAQQQFGDRVTCNIQGGSNPMTTECNIRTIKAKSDGTTEVTVQHSETPYSCDCPPGQGDM